MIRSKNPNSENAEKEAKALAVFAQTLEKLTNLKTNIEGNRQSDHDSTRSLEQLRDELATRIAKFGVNQ